MHPILIIIIYMDLAITAFFFLIYTFVLNRYLRFILWPVAVSEDPGELPWCAVHMAWHQESKRTEKQSHLPYFALRAQVGPKQKQLGRGGVPVMKNAPKN